MVIFHSYVSLPEGSHCWSLCRTRAAATILRSRGLDHWAQACPANQGIPSIPQSFYHVIYPIPPQIWKIYENLYIFIYSWHLSDKFCIYVMFLYVSIISTPKIWGLWELGRLGAWYLAAPWPQGPRGSDGPGSHSGPGAGGTPGPSIIPEVNGGSMGKSSFPYSNP